MKLDLDDDQQQLADSVIRFTDREYAFDRRVAMMEEGADAIRRNWRAFAELGWLAAGLPEAVGGFGDRPRDQLVVVEALGKALALEPLVGGAILPARTILAADADRATALLEPLIVGSAIYAVAHCEREAHGSFDHVGATANRTATGWTLAGRKALIDGGPLADLILISARTAGDASDIDGVCLFAVPRENLAERLMPYALIDGRSAADLDLTGLHLDEGALIGKAGAAMPAILEGLDHAVVAACAEAVGALDAMLWMTRDYLRTREQFGVKIGSFQALQHAMADMLIDVEQSRSMLLRGIAALDCPTAVRMKAVSACKSFISRSAVKVARTAIQLHGAIGLTDEYPVSHYFKRITVFAASYGSVAMHNDRFRTIA